MKCECLTTEFQGEYVNARDRKLHNFIICNILQVKPTGQINFKHLRVQRRIIL